MKYFFNALWKNPESCNVCRVATPGAPQKLLGLLLSVKLAFVLAVGRFTFDAAGQAAFEEALANACHRAFGHLQRFGRVSRASPPFVNFEQDANACLLCRRAFPPPETSEEMRALVCAQFDTVLW